MIEQVTVDNRPATAAYLTDAFEPTTAALATLVKVVFTDDKGGVAFLVPAGVKGKDNGREREREKAFATPNASQQDRPDTGRALGQRSAPAERRGNGGELGRDARAGRTGGGIIRQDYRAEDEIAREWDESKHPRVPSGSSEGGQFGSGGGGGGEAVDDKDKPSAKPAEKPSVPKPTTTPGPAHAGKPSDIAAKPGHEAEHSSSPRAPGKPININIPHGQGPGPSLSSRIHDPMTKFSARRASDLYQAKSDQKVDVEAIVDKYPGAREAILKADADLKAAPATDAPVSEGGYKLRPGKGVAYTRERREIQKNEIRKYFTPEKIALATPKSGERPTLSILGGRGGSGKSWFTKTGMVDKAHAIYVNGDDFKEALPEYKGWNAGQLHEEATHLANVAERYARRHGLNVVHDGTMKSIGTNAKILKTLEALYYLAKEFQNDPHNYKVNGYYMFASPQTATERAVKRFMEEGRYVPPAVVAANASNEATFDALSYKMDDWKIYDNDSPDFKPQLYAQKSTFQEDSEKQHPGEGYSKDSYIKNGVIYTSSVDDAQRALYEDRKVELDQPKMLSTLITRLGEVTKSMIAMGQKAPVFNLCNVTVAGTNLFCVDEETEILTSDGWRRYDHIAVGDEVLTLNHETGFSEWQPIQALNIYPAEPRLVVSFDSPSHSSLTTLGHRWPITRPGGERRWTTSALLGWEDRVPTAARCTTLPIDSIYSDALVELVAWAWTEGNTSADALRIYQSQTKNPTKCDDIRVALTVMFGEARDNLMSIRAAVIGSRLGEVREPTLAWRESYNAATGMVSFHLNAPAAGLVVRHFLADKVVRPSFIRALTRSQLEVFVDRSIDADGHRGASTDIFSQRSEERVRIFEMACALLGRKTSTSIHPERRPGRNPDAKQFVVSVTRCDDKVARPVAIAKSKGIAARESVVLYEGQVWCPTTSNGTWLARRRGTVYYTGNCQQSKGIPRAEMPQLNDVQTKLFRGYLEKKGYTVTKGEEYSANLRATQAQLNGAKVAKVAGIIAKNPANANRLVIISKDDYVLDGHHHWAAMVGLDAADNILNNDHKIKVQRVDIGITKLLEEANLFTEGKGKQSMTDQGGTFNIAVADH